MQTVAVVVEHSRMNLHYSAALLNIATKYLSSVSTDGGEHCHLQLGKLQKQGHKSQINRQE